MPELAILGFGIMGERLARAAVMHERWRLAAAWDPDPAAAARLAAIAPGARFCAGPEAAVALAHGVHVASPPGAHVAQGRMVLEAGRALLLEKPLSNDADAARRFVAWAEGRPAAVNFPMVSSPAVAALRAALPGIGAVRAAEITLGFAAWPRPWQLGAAAWLSRRSEGGFLREVGSHFLFLAARFIGPLALESGRAAFPGNGGSETFVEAALRAGSVPITLRGAVGGTAQDDTNRFVLEGERGRIRLRDWSFAETWTDGAWRHAAASVPNSEMRPLTLSGQLDRLADLVGGEATDLATLDEALAVQEVVEAILRQR